MDNHQWEARTRLLCGMFLAAVREALPQQTVSEVQIGYRCVDETEDELGIPQGCVRVEIIRPGNGLLARSFLDLSVKK
jgi:hypothetical protein